ncbi:MAG: substrate-binding domain-containing protein [Galbitalea sp.]
MLPARRVQAPRAAPAPTRSACFFRMMSPLATPRLTGPYFTAAIKKLNPNATVLYQNANGSASNQQQQATAMLANGVKVLVLDAFDGEAAQSIVTAAIAKKVPVIDYDRLVDGGKSNYYVSFDNEKVGVLQGTAFVNQLKKEGVPSGSGILMVDGSPTDNNATLFAKGAHSIIDPSGYKVLAEYQTPGWDPAQAQTWAASQFTKFGSQIKGIYAANDGTAGGVIAAAHAAKFDLSKMALTGQDATVAGMQEHPHGVTSSCPSTRPSSLRHRRPRRSRSTSPTARSRPLRPRSRAHRVLVSRRSCWCRFRSPATTSSRPSSPMDSTPPRRSAPVRTLPCARSTASSNT